MWASSASRLWECWLPEDAPGAELGPHGQRHLRRPAGHERQLGRLVEQLVEADAEEVEVHHLDHGAHPGHRRANTEADDRRLGDRGVAHAVAELVGEPPGQPEDVATGADVDAGDEHPVVLGELELRGRSGWRPWCGTPARRRAAAAAPSLRSWPARRSPSGWPPAGLASRRAASTAPSSAVGHRGLERLDLVVPDARVPKPGLVDEQRVTSLPLAHLVRRPVALGIAFVVTVPAVGRRLDDGGTAPGAGGVDRRPP